MPSITELPDPPTRSDPTNFAARADAFLAQLVTFAQEANDLAAAMNVAVAGRFVAPLSSVAGTNAITATSSPTVTAYTTHDLFRFVPAGTNTGATTINIDGVGAKNVFCGGAACVGGEIRQNVPCLIHYDGTQFNIIGPYVGGNLPAGQIKFPATQNASSDANTLDDYEEGSITPAVLSGGNQVGRTYSVQSGSYTKVGNSVRFRARVTLSALGSSTGATTIALTGAPTSANTHLVPVTLIMNSGPAGVTTAILGYMNANATTIDVVTFAAGSITALDETGLDDNTELYVSGEYAV